MMASIVKPPLLILGLVLIVGTSCRRVRRVEPELPRGGNRPVGPIVASPEALGQIPPPLPELVDLDALISLHPNDETSEPAAIPQILVASGRAETIVAGIARAKATGAADASVIPNDSAFLAFTNRHDNGFVSAQLPLLSDVEPQPEQPSSPDGDIALAGRFVGGSLLPTGKVLLVGELRRRHFAESQFHLLETASADRTIFLAVFGGKLLRLARSFRYGLSGVNRISAVAGAPSNHSILITGSAAGELLPATGSPPNSSLGGPSNFIAEIDEWGEFRRFYAWPEEAGNGAKESIVAAKFADGVLVIAVAQGEGILLRSFRLSQEALTIVPVSTYSPICGRDGESASSDHVRLDVAQREVAIVVEKSSPTLANSYRLPCLEVISLGRLGRFVGQGEVLKLDEFPTVAGTTQVRFVSGHRILVARSRELSSSSDYGHRIAFLTFSRPLSLEGYVSSDYNLPASTDGDVEMDRSNFKQNLVDIAVYLGDAAQRTVVLVLSQLIPPPGDTQPARGHLGTYVIPPPKTGEGHGHRDQ